MEYDPKGMPFRRLGPSGLRVPVFSLGGWLTLGGTVVGDPVKDIIKTAFENGINMFDTAEEYSKGKSEVEIIIEGTKESLQRLQMDYVDVIFAHRSDKNVPMEEVVRAFNFVIDQGWAFYWGTSEWDAEEIEEAHHIASKLGLIPPIAEQCQHNMFHRERPEKEYKQLYKKYGYATTVYSALDKGILTGKYNNGIPDGSRFDTNAAFFKDTIGKLHGVGAEGTEKIRKVKALTELAEKELGCSITALALAWIAKNPNTSTVILGASKPEQIIDNLKALEVIPKLTPDVLEKIEEVLRNKPAPHNTYGRPPLDVFRSLY
ncbi:hypothetical protein ONZ45_g18697 [Pleurotus djamor]|nr:hypothetical protein ONZ45_g18697 [Pleurotus djamor]